MIALQYRLELINKSPQSADPEDTIFYFDTYFELMNKLAEILQIHKDNHIWAIKKWPEENHIEYIQKFEITTIYHN